MKFLTRAFKGMLYISLLAYAGSFFYKPALPSTAEILPAVLENEPKQEAVVVEPNKIDIKGYAYTLMPHYSYELYGLVVSLYDADNIFDFTHKNDPGNMKDICVVWGDNIKSGAYKKVKFSSGEFTCFGRWEQDFSPPFSGLSGSNNHLIPADENVAHRIRNVIIGDQVRVQGYLADYRVQMKGGQTLYTRNTSTTRTDTGNGACEVVYVTDIEILKKGNGLAHTMRYAGFWGALGSFLILVGLEIFLPWRFTRTPASML
ncbi:MAG: hypothetical protein Q7S09_03055 [bacterium]|nr:hypothetical protein [bacterium]